MNTTSLERVLGKTARDLLTRIDAGHRGGAIRTQAAIVRSLVDEIDHHCGRDRRAACLREQAREELVRLMLLINGMEGDQP